MEYLGGSLTGVTSGESGEVPLIVIPSMSNEAKLPGVAKVWTIELSETHIADTTRRFWIIFQIWRRSKIEENEYILIYQSPKYTAFERAGIQGKCPSTVIVCMCYTYLYTIP